MRLKTILAMTFIIPSLALAQKKRIASWSETALVAGISSFSNSKEPINMLGLAYEARFEKYAMTYAVQNYNSESSKITSTAIGGAVYPDWELPFEPGAEFKVGLLNGTLNEQNFTSPSYAVKLSMTVFKRTEIGLAIRFFGEWGTSRIQEINSNYYLSGVQVILGAQ